MLPLVVVSTKSFSPPGFLDVPFLPIVLTERPWVTSTAWAMPATLSDAALIATGIPILREFSSWELDVAGTSAERCA